MEAVWLAIIVAGGALLSSLLTTWLSGKLIRQGKEQDYERQDEVARQAAKAADLLLAANERVAKQTSEAAKATNGKLNQIHELVNSTMTSQMEDNHRSLTQQLVLMHEVITLNEAAGRKPSQEALDAIKFIERKISNLGSELKDRAKATEIADSKLNKSSSSWPTTEEY